jgi:hypothetical protein
MMMRRLFTALLLLPVLLVNAQKKAKSETGANEIYIDKKGVLRLSATNAEASYFGVNYTFPFAYGYRSHQALNIDIEKAIDQDVYHFARLGINAFRVHVWDTEISDSTGNLINNEHLRLFDYLLSKLEERKIRIIITPIAFWGNGYPDKDDKTGSFVEKYGKKGAVTIEAAFKAQEKYLAQFFRHVNPYTRKTYGQDQFVIATEINNEPNHSGEKQLTTNYINRMKAAIVNSGWTKPVFYNISESPAYADAVARSKADGFSFQWYPTGLVAGHELKGNLLPNVDRYHIPFDTIPQFLHKPKMIYEFDAADVLKSYMYPAMARSFRTAGFQWATQFAYDPLGTAYANTEYQTHYLNLAYTPAKAISLLIAAKVFRQTPLYKSYGSFPADTAFGPFTVSYKRQLSEMNTATEFYYSNHTLSVPVKASALQHIAGVGTSKVAAYRGTGAYFLDKLAEGSWRLEVLPDVVQLKDPFAKNTLDNAFTQVINRSNQMKINLADLGAQFQVMPLNKDNLYATQAVGSTFDISPGTYLISKKGIKNTFNAQTKIGTIGLHEFVDPVAMFKSNPKISFAEPTVSGRRKRDTISFAGRLPESAVAGSTVKSVSLYQAGQETEDLVMYSPDWKTDPYELIKLADGQQVLQLSHKPSPKPALGGLEIFVKDKLQRTAANAVASFKMLKITASASIKTAIKIVLFDADGAAYTAAAVITENDGELLIPISSFRKGSAVLLPRPYPGFQELNFSAMKPAGSPEMNKVEKLQILFSGNADKEFAVKISKINLQ